jgi:hypothetical protein
MKRKNETNKLERPIHPWRVCPAGQSYRNAASVRPHQRLGRPVRGGLRNAACVKNRSGKDQLYEIEITEIAKLHFGQFKSRGLGEISEFTVAKVSQNSFDHHIIGWVKYWNEILKPDELLAPTLVKALIASESGFDPSVSNGRKGPSRARGLMQILDGSLPLLKTNGKELNDHFVNLEEEDSLDPNLTICAGVRWLFRKRQIAASNLGRDVSWVEAVADYKSYLKVFLKNPKHTQMQRFIAFYEELKNAK